MLSRKIHVGIGRGRPLIPAATIRQFSFSPARYADDAENDLGPLPFPEPRGIEGRINPNLVDIDAILPPNPIQPNTTSDGQKVAGGFKVTRDYNFDSSSLYRGGGGRVYRGGPAMAYRGRGGGDSGGGDNGGGFPQRGGPGGAGRGSMYYRGGGGGININIEGLEGGGGFSRGGFGGGRGRGGFNRGRGGRGGPNRGGGRGGARGGSRGGRGAQTAGGSRGRRGAPKLEFPDPPELVETPFTPAPVTLQTLIGEVPATVLTTQGISATLRREVGTGKAGPTGEETIRWGLRNWKNHDERRQVALGKVVEGEYRSPTVQVEGEGAELHRLVMVNGTYTHAAKRKLLGELTTRLPQFKLPPPEKREAIEGPRA